MFAVGFGIVFVYVIFMLGKCNFVEQRVRKDLARNKSSDLMIIIIIVDV